MRWPAILMLAPIAAALAAFATASAQTSPATSLTVTYWTKPGAPTKTAWTLRCNPPGGTLARPRVACRKLAAGGTRLFAPVPKDAVCTEIYGGPQVARVAGTVAGKRVWASFSRTNGCHIARWNRLSPWLLPRAGTT
jgi:hypothetical protein